MATFATKEWVAGLDAAAQAAGRPLDSEVDLTIEQELTGGPEPFRYHVVFRDGAIRVHHGAADAPTMTFHQSVTTAAAIAQGTTNAQRAFSEGLLDLSGDVLALAEHTGAAAALGAVFDSVRSDTVFPDA